jgi:2-polyprenyl-6-methoxyphenol hydroxylase-like FAD-dependent oxidoreductase
VPKEIFRGARPAGPLATFEGADSWVEHPYQGGVALVGDAAASGDPTWGQGLALTLRDVRVLRDALLATDDWDAAGHAYAAEHDRSFAITHTAAGWYTELFYGTGGDANARRARAFPRLLMESDRVPDALIGGPETTEATEQTRRRFFAED